MYNYMYVCPEPSHSLTRRLGFGAWPNQIILSIPAQLHRNVTKIPRPCSPPTIFGTPHTTCLPKIHIIAKTLDYDELDYMFSWGSGPTAPMSRVADKLLSEWAGPTLCPFHSTTRRANEWACPITTRQAVEWNGPRRANGSEYVSNKLHTQQSLSFFFFFLFSCLSFSLRYTTPSQKCYTN